MTNQYGLKSTHFEFKSYVKCCIFYMQHVRILNLYTNGVNVIDIGTCYISTSQGKEGGTFELRGDRSMPPMVWYPIPYCTTNFGPDFIPIVGQIFIEFSKLVNELTQFCSKTWKFVRKRQIISSSKITDFFPFFFHDNASFCKYHTLL